MLSCAPSSTKNYSQEPTLELHIETNSQLNELCEKLRDSKWLALDTEFIREKTYYPKFCLLQISNGELAASVDPLAIEDLSPLVEIMYDQTIVKVFHAGRQDLEIFDQLWGEPPKPLFDTQLAATVLGLGNQIGYGNLVKIITGTELDKGHSRTDWSKRPLSQEQLRYALDDVIYLGDIYLNMSQRLEELGRHSWLQEDFNELADRETYRMYPETMWKRIKGNQHLKGVQLAILQQIADWREREAERINRPRRWVLKDEVVVDLARRQPKQLNDLEKIRGLEQGTIKRQGENFLELIAKAKKLPKDKWPQAHTRPPKLSQNQEAIADLLQSCLRLIAEQEEISPSALASRKDLEKLVMGKRDLELLHGWRNALVGETLLKVLNGELFPKLENGVLQLE